MARHSRSWRLALLLSMISVFHMVHLGSASFSDAPHPVSKATDHIDIDRISRVVDENRARLAASALALETQSHQSRRDFARGGASSAVSGIDHVLRRRNVTTADIDRARGVVSHAMKRMAAANKARMDHPTRNSYGPRRDKSGETVNGQKAVSSAALPADSSDAASSFAVTDEMAQAAALVAEADAATTPAIARRSRTASTYEALDELRAQREVDFGRARSAVPRDARDAPTASYWMELIDNKGTSAYGGDPSYKVFRNVKDYGAKGDGKTDDTAAINKAISDGNRCGAHCASSTTKPAVVYFPPDDRKCKYRPIGPHGFSRETLLTGRQPNHLPIIKAAPSFIGLGVIVTDVYYQKGQTNSTGSGWGSPPEWYLNTSNFYRQIRNFIVDITETAQDAHVAAFHYQVAQATSLFNVQIMCTVSGNTTQQGIFAENGSGGFMSNVGFVGGQFGIYGGTQQFTCTDLSFSQVQTAAQLIWDWGYTWKGLFIASCGVGLNLLRQDNKSHTTGSIYLQDTVIKNTTTGVLLFPPEKGPGKGSTMVTLDNVVFHGVQYDIRDTQNKTHLADDSAVSAMDFFTIGDAVYMSGVSSGFQAGTLSTSPRQPGLTEGVGGAFKKPLYLDHKRNQYASTPAGKIVQMKWACKGDGVTDDTKAFQHILDKYGPDSSNVIFVDAGAYVLTDTITIPAGARIVGQAWARLVAKGPKFQDPAVPHVLVRVGPVGGAVGSVEIQDLMFTHAGPTPGLVAVEWNLAADKPGAAAMWDAHFRMGGAAGTEMQAAQCPSTQGSQPRAQCMAGTLLLHMTATGSAYLENVWGWVADHDIDDAQNTPISVYVGRGVLVESTQPTWMYGTAFEHCTLYQYSLYHAHNVLAGMIQTESPYYQPVPAPPAPFAPNGSLLYASDPLYYVCQSGGAGQAGCDASWALRVVESRGIEIAGAGLYAFFRDYAELPCVDTRSCQNSLVYLENNNGNTSIYNLVTIGASTMIADRSIQGAQNVPSADYVFNNSHPYWSQLAVYRPQYIVEGSGSGDGGSGSGSGSGSGGDNGSVVYVPPSIWTSSNPHVGCLPPCTLVLPPSPLGSQTTFSWPPLVTTLMSLSGSKTDTITTTISVPPITTSEIQFWPITVPSGAVTSTSGVASLPGPEPSTPSTPSRTASTPSTPASTPASKPTSSPAPSPGSTTNNSPTPPAPGKPTTESSTPGASKPASSTPGPAPTPTTPTSPPPGQPTPGSATSASSKTGSPALSPSTGSPPTPAQPGTPAPGISFSPVQSVMPPPFTVSFPPSVMPFPPTPFVTQTPASSSSATPLFVIFPTSSHTITIQPQPTIPLPIPPVQYPPPLTFSSGKPKETCTAGCGPHYCGIFGCGLGGGDDGNGGGCGLFGCGGGCGIWGCGGGCGLFGCGGGLPCLLGACSGGCPLFVCGGLGCIGGGCGGGGGGSGGGGSSGCKGSNCGGCTGPNCSGGGGGGGGGGSNGKPPPKPKPTSVQPPPGPPPGPRPPGPPGIADPNKPHDDDMTCSTEKTATICAVTVHSFVPTGASTLTTTTETNCYDTAGCNAAPSTTTLTQNGTMPVKTFTGQVWEAEHSLLPNQSLSALASSIASRQSAWWASITAKFPTSTKPTPSPTPPPPPPPTTTSTTTPSVYTQPKPTKTANPIENDKTSIFRINIHFLVNANTATHWEVFSMRKGDTYDPCSQPDFVLGQYQTSAPFLEAVVLDKPDYYLDGTYNFTIPRAAPGVFLYSGTFNGAGILSYSNDFEVVSTCRDGDLKTTNCKDKSHVIGMIECPQPL